MNLSTVFIMSTNYFSLADIYVRLGLLLLSSIQEDVCRIFNTSDYTAYYSQIEPKEHTKKGAATNCLLFFVGLLCLINPPIAYHTLQKCKLKI